MVTKPIPQRSRIRMFRFWATVSVLLLVAATVTTAIIAKVERDDVARKQGHVRTVLRPARNAEADLLAAYLNQETGLRGFLLTGEDRFLQPYTMGRADAAQLLSRLTALTAKDATSRAMLNDVVTAGAAWDRQIVQPQLAARRAGAIAPATVLTYLDNGKTSFDAVRSRFTILTAHTDTQITAALRQVSQTQHDSGTATDATLIGAIALAVLALLGLRYLFALPLSRFLRQIRTVASGDYAAPIDGRGPQEFKVIADSVDRMRDSIIRTTADAAAVQQRLSLREERDRLAADLHDRTIQRVFGLGLALDSMNTRTPTVGKDIEPLVEETDKIIRELRSVILAIGGDQHVDGLRAGVVSLINDSRRSLGFLPDLDVRGPVDTAIPEHIGAEVLAVLREALSNVARHAGATSAGVALVYEDSALTLKVVDNGTGIAPDAAPGDGTRNLRARAARLDGTASISSGPNGGTVVTWRVPVPVE